MISKFFQNVRDVASNAFLATKEFAQEAMQTLSERPIEFAQTMMNIVMAPETVAMRPVPVRNNSMKR